MDERLHRALDDELSPDELPPALAAELEDARALFAGVLRAIPEDPMPELGAAVRRRVGALDGTAPPLPARSQNPRRGRLATWLWVPHRVSISIRPAYALAAVLVFAAAVGMLGRLSDRGHGDAIAADHGRVEAVLVSFRLDAPRAQSVALAGDFSNWAPAYALTRSAPGVWTIVVPLSPGVHEYSFVINGTKWVPDPAAPPKADGFGGMNSRIAVLEPDKRA